MRTRGRQMLAVAMGIGIAAAGVSMVRMIDSGYEITQMRNAFIAEPGIEDDFAWRPERPPRSFLRESGPAPAEVQTTVDSLLSPLQGENGDLERALVLARHLSEGPGRGGGIKSNTLDAYRIILSEGGGYCADYTQVLNGLAYAAGIPIREWGLSFDDYSGNGHAFSEIYDRERNEWIFIDSFYSFYVVDAETREPLSVLELRQRLASGAGTDELEVRAIRPQRFGFKTPEKALDYYRDGVDAFFLYFGNNVFSYDAHPVVATLGKASRALEETAGILLGIRPEIRLVVTGTNQASIEGLRARRYLFLVLAAVVVFLSVALVFQIRALRRYRGDGSLAAA